MFWDKHPPRWAHMTAFKEESHNQPNIPTKILKIFLSPTCNTRYHPISDITTNRRRVVGHTPHLSGNPQLLCGPHTTHCTWDRMRGLAIGTMMRIFSKSCLIVRDHAEKKKESKANRNVELFSWVSVSYKRSGGRPNADSCEHVVTVVIIADKTKVYSINRVSIFV